jgi:threonine/homoserine efflux transporter RhtA
MIYLFEGIVSRYVPALFIFIMNFIIIRALVKSKRSTNTDHKISSKEVHFAVSLIAMNFIFVLSILPYTVLAALQIQNVFVNLPADYVNTVNSLYSFGIWLLYIYESSSFFMNLGFNKLFRSELREILGLVLGTTRNAQSQEGNTVAIRLTHAKISPLVNN